MSEVKVNKITPTADCGTVTLGDSGDTIAIPAGTTVTAPSANVTNSGTVNSTTITNSGTLTNSGTITNTGTISGGTISGTIDGSVNWQTTVKTTGFTATAGEGYFCNTTSAAFTVTLPASPSAGDIVGIKDYANTADTNNITIGRNGSNIQGVANDYVISTEGLAIILLYVDATKGWLSVGQSKASDISEQQLFVTATGGTITTCGNYKIHTFTGPGTFTVTCSGNPVGNDKIDYLVLAGGGGSGSSNSGGGGAGGFRESRNPANAPAWSASPLVSTTSLTLPATGYPITVGGGGTAGASGTGQRGGNGNPSVFSTITSTGGGEGHAFGNYCVSGKPGGSGGGGGGRDGTAPTQPGGGSGNTPPVSPPQGNNGGEGRRVSTLNAGGGGGGAGGAGTPSPSNCVAGAGGSSITTSITGSAVARAGGGGGSAGGGQLFGAGPGTGGAGGGGGAGAGVNSPNNGNPASANSGSGAGGGGSVYAGTDNTGGAGGSGIVVIRYKFQ